MRIGNRVIMLVAALLLGGALAGSAIAGAPPARGSGGCILPRLAGTPLNVVRGLLPRLGCRLGTITRRPSIAFDRTTVIRTRPPAGRYRRNRAIDLVVSGGPAGGRGVGAITGSGTNDDPYVGSCGERQDGACQVEFDVRRLNGFLANEYVPAYRCPDSEPWLLKKVLSNSIVPPGVVNPPLHGEVGVNITGVSTKVGKTKTVGPKLYSWDYATGTKTGFPNSSATQWSLGYATYQILIWCTSDLSKANLIAVRG